MNEMEFKENNYLIPAYEDPEDYVDANYSDLAHDYQHPNLNRYLIK